MQEHMDPELCYPMGTNGVVKFVAGGIDMPCGLTMRYPDLRQVDDGYWTEWQYRTRLKTGTLVWSKLYGGLLTENIIQSLARQVISEHIVKVSERYPVVLTVHDEIVTLIPEKHAEEHHAWIADVCSQAPKWAPGLPVACEGGFAKEYSK
jgi:DNA polymerase